MEQVQPLLKTDLDVVGKGEAPKTQEPGVFLAKWDALVFVYLWSD